MCLLGKPLQQDYLHFSLFLKVNITLHTFLLLSQCSPILLTLLELVLVNRAIKMNI